MRTLQEEVLYMREEGFKRNTLEITTLMPWLGEMAVLVAERDAATRKADSAERKVAELSSIIVKCKRAFDSGKQDAELSAALQRVFNGGTL